MIEAYVNLGRPAKPLRSPTECPAALMELTVLHAPSRGIGKAISAGFAKEGANVILVARSKGGLAEVRK